MTLRKRWIAPAALLAALAWGCSSGGGGDCAATDTCPNARPSATITAPATGTSVPQGTQVVFQGSGSDPEDGTLTGASLTWTSSLDGQLGTGGSITRGNLSPGSHTIRLIARDSDGAADTASIALTVVANQSPTASITAPANNGSAEQGVSVSFTGTGSDPEDGALTGASLAWTSDLDGPIGTGTSFARSDLSLGTHTITLEATDALGASGFDVIAFTITPAGGAPAVSIDAPSENANGVPPAFAQGATVNFQGSATDAEDGPLSGASLVWTSNVDGQIGMGESFSRSDLAVGQHTVVLTATDSETNQGVDTLLLNVSPPADGANYNLHFRLSKGVTLTPGQETALEVAKQRWEAIIAANLTSALVVNDMMGDFLCGGATVPPVSEVVDDLIIYIEFVPIDGPGGVAGSAGPCFVRDPGGDGINAPGDLPALGGMRFDDADLATLESFGLLDEVIVHEVGHVLGFGTLWNAMGFLQNPSANASCPPPDTHFDGAQAVAAMQSLETGSGTTYTGGARVPAENDRCPPDPVFGAGSLDGHWRESVFTTELLTPALNVGSNPLSVLTIESMEDLGYAVDPAEAQPYAPVFSITFGEPAATVVLRDDVDRGPLWTIGPDGTVRRVR